MDSGDGPSDEPSTSDEDGAHPSLRDLVEKVDERRASKGKPPDFDPELPREGDSITERFTPESTEPKRQMEEFGTDPKTEAIIEVLGDASNLLLLGPLLTPADHELCSRLTTALPHDLDNLLLVTLTESPDERVAVYQGYLDQLPRRTTVLRVGDSTSSARETIHIDDGGTVTVETISDPTDLMRIGITISRILSEWADTGGDTAICFHSLTSLLQFATESKTVFRFVHVLRGRLQSMGAYAHFHMDAAAHDTQTVSTYRPLFDEVLTFEEDGTLHVDH